MILFSGSPGLEDKSEMDNRSIYVGNVRLILQNVPSYDYVSKYFMH